MKKILSILVLLFFAGLIKAQSSVNSPDTVRYWNNTGQFNLAFSQVSLTNWAAGGQNSFSGNALARYEAVYTKNKSSWDSYILTAYGLTRQGGGHFIKNDDRLELFSKYGYQAVSHWDYAAVLDFKTQFTPGYSNAQELTGRISDFMAPGYLTASIGMDYKPSKVFALFLSPVTSRFTFVRDDSLSAAGAYGVDPGKKMRTEFGGYVKMILNKENLIPNVNVASTLDLFSNYEDHPERVDVNWDLLVGMKINKYLSVTLNTDLIYDYNIKFQEIVNNVPVEKAKVQFKEVLGLGFSANF